MTSVPSSPSGPSVPVIAGAIAAAIGMGALVAIQSRLNGELGRRLDDGVVAALISFGGGLVVLALGLIVWRPGREGLGRVLGEARHRRIPWWYLVGGAAGSFLVLSQGVTAATLGVALFTVGTVCGQTVSASVVDRVGLGTLRGRPLRLTRIVGTVLALLAVVFAVSSNIRADVPVWMLVFPFVAGAGVGWQQAVNGQVRHYSRSALTAAFVNFTVGTVVLGIASVVVVLIVGAPRALPGQWWLYLGGPIGVIFIGGAAAIVHVTGVLLLGLATISGQLVASVLLDVIVPAPGHEIVATTVVGTALTLVAVAIAALPARRRAPSRA